MARTLRLCLLVPLLAAAAEVRDPAAAVDAAREAARRHRYVEAVRLLEPLEGRDDLPDEVAFAAAAELGRAHYHLGRYADGYRALRRALALQPRSAEAAVYLEACAWLTGRREEALAVFEALVASGAADLHLAVTLPGEATFLADPRTWEAVERHARPFPVDLRRGEVLGVALGMRREEAAAVLPSWPRDAGRAVTVRAGPRELWAFRLEDGRVAEALVLVENLLRYTPYRLRLACGLDWRATAEALERLLGPPARRREDAAGVVRMVWRFGAVEATVELGPPREPAPPGVAPGSPILQVLRLRRVEAP